MATRIRNKSWAHDQSLKEVPRNYSRKGLQSKKILSFIFFDFGEYAWSLRSFDRRLSYFIIQGRRKLFYGGWGEGWGWAETS